MCVEVELRRATQQGELIAARCYARSWRGCLVKTQAQKQCLCFSMDDRDSGMLRKQSWPGSSSNVSSARSTSEWGSLRAPLQGTPSMMASSTFLPTLESGKTATNLTPHTGHPQASNDVSKLQAELNLLRERSWLREERGRRA